MIMKGKNVVLRPLRLSDAARFTKWMADPEVNKFLARRSVSLKENIEWLKGIPKRKDARFFAIDVNKVHVGMISLRGISKVDHNAVYTIMIGDRSYQGKGHGREATELILDYGFRKLKLHRISLNVYSYNVRAIDLYNKLGFTLEGKLRKQCFYGGRYHDEFLMGMLASEWRKKFV
jgi:RimJ/RimL family protein N-acetyltransferase